MNITLGNKPISTDKLRTLGFALIDLATSVDRYHLQAAQAVAKPSDKEQQEADRAASRAIGAMRKARRLIDEATR
jgi:hypothetical protein